MRVATVIIGLLAATTMARAEWKIESFKDRMTDRDVKIGTLKATKPDAGITAALVVRCMISDVVGGLYVEIATSASFTRGRMGLRYRVDAGETIDRYMPISSNGRGMALWAQPSEFADGKRLRVELQPGRGPTLFYDFDLTGTRDAFRSIPCRETKL